MSAGTAPKKSDYLEILRREIAEKFQQALAKPEKPIMTLEQKAEILFNVALRKMRLRLIFLLIRYAPYELDQSALSPTCSSHQFHVWHLE